MAVSLEPKGDEVRQRLSHLQNEVMQWEAGTRQGSVHTCRQLQSELKEVVCLQKTMQVPFSEARVRQIHQIASAVYERIPSRLGFFPGQCALAEEFSESRRSDYLVVIKGLDALQSKGTSLRVSEQKMVADFIDSWFKGRVDEILGPKSSRFEDLPRLTRAIRQAASEKLCELLPTNPWLSGREDLLKLFYKCLKTLRAPWEGKEPIEWAKLHIMDHWSELGERISDCLMADQLKLTECLPRPVCFRGRDGKVTFFGTAAILRSGRESETGSSS